MAQYKTGTVSVTNGSATVTGSGTLWSGEIAAGDLFTIVGDNAWYEVASVGSNTSLTLSANYAGTTGSGKSYAISRDFTTRLALPYPQKGDIETASIIKRAFEQIDTETNIATANYSATSAPTANDDSGDGYSIGSWWVNVTSDEAYLCVDSTVGAAVWTKISVDVPSEIVALLAGQSVSMASLTLSGGTANGVLYLNGSKVATSGSALTFDGTTTLGLTVAGTGSVLNGYNITNGTASGIFKVTGSTYSYRGVSSNVLWIGGDGNPMYVGTSTDQPLLFGTNAYELMRLTSTGLGVGTSSPGSRLNVVGGSVTLSGTASFNSEIFQEATAKRGLIFGYDTSSQVGIIAGHTNGNPSNLAFWTFNGSSWAERLRISSDGNLGLGVTPSAWGSDSRAMQFQSGISVFSNTSGLGGVGNNVYSIPGTGDYYIANGYATRYYQYNGTHVWDKAANNSSGAGASLTFTQAMTLDASGNLGIGTTSPAYVLNTNYSAPSSFTNTGSNFTQMWQASGTNALGIALSTGDTTARFVTNNGYKFAWNLASTQAMTLDSSGNLLVGTTATNAALEQGFTAVINNGGSKMHVGHINGTVNGESYAVFSYNTSAIGTITQNGTTAVSYNTSSDYRLKNITGPITNSGAYIDSLNPVEGTWKADGSTFVGLIAHEVQEASRTNVATGVKDGEQMQGMDYSSAEIIANLIAEVKSLRARVAALES